MKPASPKLVEKLKTLFVKLVNGEPLSQEQTNLINEFLSTMRSNINDNTACLSALSDEQIGLTLKLAIATAMTDLVFLLINQQPELLDEPLFNYQTGAKIQLFKPMHLAVYFNLDITRNSYRINSELRQRFKNALNSPAGLEQKASGEQFASVGMTPFLLALSQKKYELAYSIYKETLSLSPNIFPENYGLVYDLNPFKLALNHAPKLFIYMLQNGYFSETKYSQQALYLAVQQAIYQFNQGDKTLLSRFLNSPSHNKRQVIFSLSAIQFAVINCNIELLMILLPAVRGSTLFASNLQYLEYKNRPLLEVVIKRVIVTTRNKEDSSLAIKTIKFLIAAGLDVDDKTLNEIFGSGFFHRTTALENEIRSLIKVGRLFAKAVKQYAYQPFSQQCLQAYRLNSEYFNEIVMLSIGPNNVNQSITLKCDSYDGSSQYNKVLTNLLELAGNELTQHCLTNNNKTKLIEIVKDFYEANFIPDFQRAPTKPLVTLKQKATQLEQLLQQDKHSLPTTSQGLVS